MQDGKIPFVVHDGDEDFAVVFVGFYHTVSQGTGVCLLDEGFLCSPPCPYRFFGWSVGIRGLRFVGKDVDMSQSGTRLSMAGWFDFI